MKRLKFTVLPMSSWLIRAEYRDVHEKFLEFIKDAGLVAHNAPFDVGFMDYEFSKVKVAARQNLTDLQNHRRTLAMAKCFAYTKHNNGHSLWTLWHDTPERWRRFTRCWDSCATFICWWLSFGDQRRSRFNAEAPQTEGDNGAAHRLNRVESGRKR